MGEQLAHFGKNGLRLPIPALAGQDVEQQKLGFQVIGMLADAAGQDNHGLIHPTLVGKLTGQWEKDLGIGFDIEELLIQLNFACHRPHFLPRPFPRCAPGETGTGFRCPSGSSSANGPFFP